MAFTVRNESWAMINCYGPIFHKSLPVVGIAAVAMGCILKVGFSIVQYNTHIIVVRP